MSKNNNNIQVEDSRNFQFTIIENALIDDESLDIYTKMTYVVLCKFANPINGNTCFPSLSTISKKVGCGVTKIKQTIKKLEEKGFIIKKNRFKDENKREKSSNLYQIIGYKQGVPTVSDGVGHHTTKGRSPHDQVVGRHTTKGIGHHTTSNKNKDFNNNYCNNNNNNNKSNSNIKGANNKNKKVFDNTIIEYKQRIDKALNSNEISEYTIETLLKANNGKENIEYVIENWDNFNCSGEKKGAGFFRMAVEGNWKASKREANNNNNNGLANFEQRECDTDYYKEIENKFSNSIQ